MELTDLLYYFEDVEVGYFNPKYEYESQNLLGNRRHAAYFSIDIQQEGEYYFSMH